MSLNEKQRAELNKRVNEFTKNTNISIDVDKILQDFENNQKETSYYMEAFTKTYKNALNDQVVPGVMSIIKDGDTSQSAGRYFDSIMEYIYESTAPESVKDAENKFKESEDVYLGHMMYDEYTNAVKEAFRLNNNVFGTVPTYINDAKNNNVNIHRFMIEATIKNALIYKRWDDVTEEYFNSTLRALAPSYMVIHEKYNELGFFGKWFTGKGQDYRYFMNHCKDGLNALKAGTSINCNVRDALHAEALNTREVIQEMVEPLTLAFNAFSIEPKKKLRRDSITKAKNKAKKKEAKKDTSLDKEVKNLKEEPLLDANESVIEINTNKNSNQKLEIKEDPKVEINKEEKTIKDTNLDKEVKNLKEEPLISEFEDKESKSLFDIEQNNKPKAKSEPNPEEEDLFSQL